MVSTQPSKEVVTAVLLLLVHAGSGGLLDKGFLEEGETLKLRGAAMTTHTIRLPVAVRTVRVTRTFAVPVPVPFPVRRDVPVPVHVPKPIPVPVSYPVPQAHLPEPSNPFPFYTDPAHSLYQEASNPVAQFQKPSARTFGSPGSTIGLNDGSFGVVVGASYGVSDSGGFEGKQPGIVLNDAVGITGNQAASSLLPAFSASNTGNPAFSISKSIESTFDGTVIMGNNIQGDDKGMK